MDADRFDSLLRSLAETPSRRSALRLLAGAAFGAALAPLAGLEEIKAHNALKKCQKIEGKDKRQKCRRKARRHNRRHANPSCVPACPAGQDCLSNGSCAIPCTGSPDVCPSPACFCGDPSTEGLRYCSVGNTLCEAHTACTSTAGCLPGEHCAPCGGTNRCLPLCP